MARITALSYQKRDPTRCNIELDGEYALALPALEVSSQGLKVGMELSDADVENLEKFAQSSKYYAMAVRYIGVRVRSAFEVRQYLRRKDAPTEETHDIVERLTRSGLLDDLDFAKRWVADRSMLKLRSRRQLEQELMAKGVNRDVIQEALGDQDADARLAIILQLIRKKLRVGQVDEQKLKHYLLRQGFEYSLITQALDELNVELDTEVS